MSVGAIIAVVVLYLLAGAFIAGVRDTDEPDMPFVVFMWPLFCAHEAGARIRKWATTPRGKPTTF